MEKSESIVSIVVTALLVLVVLGIQRRWNGSMFTNMAASAENFVLKTTGLRGRIPDLPGYEQVRTFYLERYRAALYRATPAPLVFAVYRFVIYDMRGQPVFKVDTIEASTVPWSKLYDFAGRHGLPDLRIRGGPVYTRDLTGGGNPDVILGQYSGGDHCCSTVTVIELGKDSVEVVGQIAGLDGLPFDGLEVLRLERKPGWQLVTHRPRRTVCSQHRDAADVISIYTYSNGHFSDQTPRFTAFLNRVLQGNLAKWRSDKLHSLRLLQTIAADYSRAGKPGAAQEFLKQNLPSFYAQLQSNGIDPQACSQDLSNLVNSLAPQPPQTSQDLSPPFGNPHFTAQPNAIVILRLVPIMIW